MGKEREEAALAAVLHRLGLGEFEIMRSESPDFFVSLKHRAATLCVACEMTTLYSDRPKSGRALGSPQRRFFRKWTDLATRLRCRLDEVGLVNLYGVLDFNIPSPAVLDSVKIDSLIDELVSLCKRHSETRSDLAFPVGGFPLLHSLLSSIRLYQCTEPGALWWCGQLQSGPVPEPTDALIDIIRTKVEKAHSYDWRDVTERLLVVVAEARGTADVAVNIKDPGIRESVPDVEFTTIVLWDRFMDDLVELYPVFAKLCDSTTGMRCLECYPLAFKPFVVTGPDYPRRVKSGG